MGRDKSSHKSRRRRSSSPVVSGRKRHNAGRDEDEDKGNNYKYNYHKDFKTTCRSKVTTGRATDEDDDDEERSHHRVVKKQGKDHRMSSSPSESGSSDDDDEPRERKSGRKRTSSSRKGKPVHKSRKAPRRSASSDTVGSSTDEDDEAGTGRAVQRKAGGKGNVTRSSESDDDDGARGKGKGGPLQAVTHVQQSVVLNKAEKQKQKELMKAMEMPEEKRLRRLMKKELKERKRKERMGWDKDYMHYTNTDNPFGDANLLETFVWSKKLDKEGLSNILAEEIEHQSKLKQEENRRELEKVKKRRLEREQERARREDELQQLQRQKEAAQFKEWEKQEDIFHLQQARLRSKIRIQDGRAKPIDLLAKYVSTEDEDLAVDMHEPYMYLNGLTIGDLEDLIEDIKVYVELEHGKNLDYWNDITVIVEDELSKLRKLDRSARDHCGDRRDGIHSSVSGEVARIFKGKTHAQLAVLHDHILRKIHGGEEGIDVGYWESLLSQLKAHIARARLRDRHQENLRRKLFQLKQEQGVASEPLFPSANYATKEKSPPTTSASTLPRPMPPPTQSYMSKPAMGKSISSSRNQSRADDSAAGTSQDDQSKGEDPLEACYAEYRAGCYSPHLIQPVKLEPGTLLTDPREDSVRLEFSRQQLIGTGSVPSHMTSDERAFEREARKGMTDEEAVFSVEAVPEQKTYLWSDKYRPRKPRYFNRVHTGFEWNKYNQTHYDMDNPPPKIVQGYKFNIFYPDLIDKNVTPEYILTPCEDNKDFAILRFRAGPPYEDIAFKIVNREWEYSYKRGFRCQFHNNIFQLWFHFKRYRYRR